MTVAKLVEMLQEVPQDAVLVNDGDFWTRITGYWVDNTGRAVSLTWSDIAH